MPNYVRFDNLLIEQGDDRPFSWPITDQSGEPVDLTGYTARAQVRDTARSATVLHEWSTTAGNVALTDSTVTLLVRDSLDWTWDHGRYDLRVTDTQGNTEVIARGTVVLTAAVTR